MTSRSPRILLAAAVVAAAACQATEERPASDSAALPIASLAPAPAPAPTPGRFTAADFAHLRWLEGRWRGRLEDGGHFYEQYRMVDDSTIVMQAFADSTFGAATDSAHITLREGTVADEGGRARWVATRLDSTGVEFAPERGASNSFTWARESADRWTATLRSGGGRTTVYPMERVGS